MQKFNLIDCSVEEQKAFATDFDILLKQYPTFSIGLSIVKKAMAFKKEDGTIENFFVDSPAMIIQNKVEIKDENNTTA